VHLRDVRLDDVEAYVRMRCDPVMMSELGGPQPRAGIEAKVASDVAQVAAGTAWICMVVPGDDEAVVAGSVVIWDSEHDGATLAEVGWMVLPEHQGQGLARAAVRLLLDRNQVERRWGPIHAFPGVTNAASNALCRSLGFSSRGEEEIEFAGGVFQCNHWVLERPAPG
jgi:RimJ/RimL family protein N-acetyltransferase